MLDTVSLSEEELGMLFGPASHGATGNTILRKPRATRSCKKSTANSLGKRASIKSTKSSKMTTKPIVTSILNVVNTVTPARCGYRTGKCQNLQAFKRNGKLHKLCEFHRERANLNQKKLDRKKRLQRSKQSGKATSSCGSVSSASSVTSEDDNHSLDLEDRSPRTVEEVTSSIFVKTEPKTEPNELDPELVLPTSLDEAPLVLGCEELAIFCSLMAFDIGHRMPDSPPSACTPSCHNYTRIRETASVGVHSDTLLDQ
ncbi:hypothetical protein P3T76_003921 [Phytophthora citrophthora]|uniref:Uncharacterized protein n=1 Tax=Phytophthora citrophthora TaxID=4793 RepID=A0AAD9GWB7_9STRA|nr:hypothetical protein P3T76_003921 [Phytophthora citrophthora]